MGYAPGTKIHVREFGGRELTRRVVRDIGKTVVVCNEQEYERARSEHREPDGIGFPREAVKPLQDSTMQE
jgi:hypothetical protein